MGRGAEFLNDYLVISRVLPLFDECNKTKNHRSNTSCDKTLKRRVDAAKCKMKKVIKHILYLCLPLFSFVLLTGCIKENLEGWFKAGVTCVGMGSNLFPKEAMAAKDWAAITKLCKDALDIISEIR